MSNHSTIMFHRSAKVAKVQERNPFPTALDVIPTAHILLRKHLQKRPVMFRYLV
jgi:hypothetical protein